MIKTTTKNTPHEPIPFPKLMISTGGTIVLFQSKGNRALLAKGHEGSVLELGENAEWMHESFADYNEPITIQNA